MKMKKITMFLCAVAMSICVAGSARATSINNGSFETGDFSGWVTNSWNGGSPAVVTSNGGFTATDGSYFASLAADSTMRQHGIWHAGDILTFDWNFNANDYMPFNDYAEFYTSGGSSNDIIRLSDVATVGDYNATGWNAFEYMFTEDLNGYINFRVYNVLDNGLDSELYIDNVVSTPVPEPASMFLFGIGLIGLAGLNRRIKKA